ncbi:hypothetical protein BDB01DRAFT_806094 [Pilobolus umbonatus]|nr:hypothetical protein BDB01DRAFT_806094 [Pilobolus umbonatus]
MFRFRKNTAETLSSSLSNGNASIMPTTKDEIPIRAVIDEPVLPIEREERREMDGITMESMSAVIAAAVQITSSGKAPSSLSLGNASIIPIQKQQEPDIKKRRLFSNPFKKASTAETDLPDDLSESSSPRSSSSVSSPQPTPAEINLDDGRDELLYRGIQIKEIKTTLKPLIITDEDRCPMPTMRLERPGFARINY